MTALCECDFIHWCPICGLKLDYTPCYIEVRKCPNNHYEETHYHYGSDYWVDGKAFHFDDGGYSQPNKELQEAIEKARKTELPQRTSCEVFLPL